MINAMSSFSKSSVFKNVFHTGEHEEPAKIESFLDNWLLLKVIISIATLPSIMTESGLFNSRSVLVLDTRGNNMITYR